MQRTGPFTSQLPLLSGIEVLIILSFVLSILALFAGTSTGSLKQSAIITFNTSALANAGSPDWYEVNYLSVCYGAWNTNGDKNESTSICVHQKAGYTFSLARTLASSNATHLLPSDSSYGTLDTKASLVLLIIGITLAGVSLLSLLYGIAILLATSKLPLLVLRVGYLASISAVILLTISSAKITALADKMTGAKDIGGGVVVHAWMGWAFYVSTWLATAFMWVALGFSITVAFKIAAALEVRKSNVRQFRADKQDTECIPAEVA